MIDGIIKIVLAVLKILVDYKTANLPESTKQKQSAKGEYEEREQKFKEAIVNRDPVTISAMFEQLRCASLAGDTGTGDNREGENSNNSSQFAEGGKIPAGQWGIVGETGKPEIVHGPAGPDNRLNTGSTGVLPGIGSVVAGTASSGEQIAYAPPEVSRRAETNRIIWHHSASNFGDVETIDGWHRERGFVCIGYHYAITLDGKIEHGRKLQLVGAHAQGRNRDSVGVCVVGHFGNYSRMRYPNSLYPHCLYQKPNEKQASACVRLYHDLCRAYGKTLVNEFHHEDCPGKHLNRNEFIKALSDAI